MNVLEGIAYQNKDILSKMFAESMKEKSFSVYGVNLPKVVEVLPTNLPTVHTDELRMDNLFRLEDDSILLVDYESKYCIEDMVDYLNYVSRILKKYVRTWKNPRIRVVILYTSDVEKANAKLDIGCLNFFVEQAFLVKMDTDKILDILSRKITDGHQLTEEEQMQCIILPLTVKGKEEKQKLLKKVIDMVESIAQDGIRTFVLAGILTFTDKIISMEMADEIRRKLKMLKVERIIFEEGLEEGIEKGQRDQQIKTAEKLMRSGWVLDKIAEITELPLDSIRELKNKSLLGKV